MSTRDCDGQARLRHVEAVPLRHSSQRLLNVLWFVSNFQTQALLNQLVPCSDNAIIANEDKRDLQLLGCLAQPPLQPVRHIRVDVQDGNRCLAKTPCPLRISSTSLRPSTYRMSHSRKVLRARLTRRRTPSVLPVPGGPGTRTAH